MSVYTPWRLLIRLSCIALAALLLVSAWGNREFWTVFPFSVQTLIDITSALFLFACAFSFDTLTRTRASFVRYGIGTVMVYIVFAQALSIYAYVQVLGIPYITEQHGSFAQFMLYTLALDIGIPLALLGMLFFAVWNETRTMPTTQ